MTIREKRIAFVTGANKGIGFEVARDLARKAFHVFLGARDEKAGRAAEEKLRKDGQVTFFKIDVSEPESIRRAAGEFSRPRCARTRSAPCSCRKRSFRF